MKEGCFPVAKFTKKNNDTRITIIVIAFAVLLIAAIAAAVLLLPRGGQTEPTETAAPTEPTVTAEPTELTEQPTEPSEENAFPFVIPGFTLFEDVPEEIVDEQLSVLGTGCYTGTYFEDGSDEAVTNVLAIVVENIRDDWVDNADLSFSYGEKTAEFTVSALPGHRCAILLEKNRMTYTDGMTISHPDCLVFRDETIKKHEDFSADFSLEPHEGDVLVFRNISGHEFTGDAVLYYKSVAPYGRNGELLYMGGIAYAYRFEGPIALDEMRQATPPHYTLGGSAILYMGYDS